MKRYAWCLALLLIGCIGTDEVDDPIAGESIVLDRQQLALLVGDSATVGGTFFNRYGIAADVPLVWTSSNPSVAMVDAAGWVIGLVPGQTNLSASVGGTMSPPVLVTVVASEAEVAQVTLASTAGNQIGVGQEVALSVEVFNVLGDPIAGLEVEYASLDPAYLAVDQNGVMTGLANGFGRTVATVEGVQSNTLGIQVGQTSRTGTFSGANGYDAAGTTELFLAENGDVMLRLGDNFDTDFALGTFIYLSNSTLGSVTRNEGLEIQEVTSGGAHLFNVSAIDPGISINEFDFVVVLCKPATITFGYAQLN